MKNFLLYFLLILLILIFVGGFVYLWQKTDKENLQKQKVEVKEKGVGEKEKHIILSDDADIEQGYCLGKKNWQKYESSNGWSLDLPTNRLEKFAENYKQADDFDYTFINEDNCGSGVFFIKIIPQKFVQEQINTTCSNVKKTYSCLAKVTDTGTKTLTGAKIYETRAPEVIPSGGGCFEYIIPGLDKYALLSFCSDELVYWSKEQTKKILQSFEFNK